MAHRNWDVNCKIYIGGLRDDANRYDLEDAFTKYGPVRNVWVARRPPGFAFVEMEDPRDAEDAVRGIDGTRVCGSRCLHHSSLYDSSHPRTDQLQYCL